MIPLINQDQIRIDLISYRSESSEVPIPQTSNWSGSFFAVSYTKPALVGPETTYASSGRHNFFTLSRHLQAKIIDGENKK